MLLVIIDDLDLIRVTCAKREANSVLIVNSNAPLAVANSLEFLQLVARWYTQESDFGCGIN